jgi:hypothetical protein
MVVTRAGDFAELKVDELDALIDIAILAVCQLW